VSGKRPVRPGLVLRVPSRTEFLALVRDVTRRMAEISGFDDALAERLALAVDEAATNVIEHAYAGAADRVVELRFWDDGAELRIDLVDDGATVDPRDVPPLDLARYASERRKGGLGMHLMGKIMDSVTFARAGQRNVCCMVKRKPEARETTA
jgi:anti-sigma regulatory factor (Ser/Thr protein kinase)